MFSTVPGVEVTLVPSSFLLLYPSLRCQSAGSTDPPALVWISLYLGSPKPEVPMEQFHQPSDET